ncbi:hypothetical protein ACHQM5_009302 [Ranunculus cassubicifolius]
MELSRSDSKRNTKNIESREKLPHELVMEILSRLHIKHLSPLRFVSKTWFNLLTNDPQFAKLQFDRFMEINNNYPDPMILANMCSKENENDPYLFLATEFTSCDKAIPLRFPFYQAPNTYGLYGICNGLLCLSRDDDKEVYIWNPLVKDHITISCLPTPSIRFPGYNRTTTGFAFGFDRDNNVYKVVRFFEETEFDEVQGMIHDSWTQISVYTIGIDFMWRTVEVDIPHALIPTCRIIPLVNGVLHWRTNRPGTTSWDLMVTFDLKEEVISELLPPQEYGVVSSWSKQYVLRKPEGYKHIFHVHTLGVSHDGALIIKMFFGGFLQCNFYTNSVTALEDFDIPYGVFLAYAYLGSIISPTVINGAGHNLLEEES